MEKVIKPNQIWEKNYANDFHYLPVRINILYVDSIKIVSEIIYSSIPTLRPTGSIIECYFEEQDAYQYKVNFGWNLISCVKENK